VEDASTPQSAVGILKRKGSYRSQRDSSESDAILPTAALPHPRKRSILKHDSFETPERLRGVLKKDSSYDEALRPILKNLESGAEDTTAVAVSTTSTTLKAATTPSSSSSEDLSPGSGAPFSDVVIDPIPGAKKDVLAASSSMQQQQQLSSSSSARKHSLKDRHPVVLPYNVSISSDDRNLANKLEQLALEAEAILLKQRLHKKEDEETQQQKAKDLAAGRR
jgi:hypothetical protein